MAKAPAILWFPSVYAEGLMRQRTSRKVRVVETDFVVSPLKAFDVKLPFLSPEHDVSLGHFPCTFLSQAVMRQYGPSIQALAEGFLQKFTTLCGCRGIRRKKHRWHADYDLLCLAARLMRRDLVQFKEVLQKARDVKEFRTFAQLSIKTQ